MEATACNSSTELHQQLCLLVVCICCSQSLWSHCAAAADHCLLCPQVAQHFGRWGQVMDVVVVKDCAAVLRLAAEASRRDAKRRAAQELVAHNAGRECL